MKLVAVILSIAAMIISFMAMSVIAHAQIFVKQSTQYTFKLPDIIATSDHIAGLTGQTGTVYLARITGSSGAITKAASANNIAEIDSVNAPGQYTLTLTSTEDATLGFIACYYKSASSDPLGFLIKVVAYDPDDAAALGLSNVTATNTRVGLALPASAPNGVGGLGVLDANSLIDVDVKRWLATAPASVTTNGFVKTALQRWLTDDAGGTPNALVTGRMDSSVGQYASLQDPATFVWGATASSYNTALTMGAKLNAAGSAGDPWATLLSSESTAGSYGALVKQLLFDGSGNVHSIVQTYAAGQDPATLVLAGVVDGTFTVKQTHALAISVITGKYAVAQNTTAHTRTTTYYRADGATTLAVEVTTYTDATLSTVVSRAVTYSNLP